VTTNGDSPGPPTRIGLLLGSRDSAGALVADDGTVLARVSVPSADAPDDGIGGLVGMAARLRRKAEALGRPATAVGVGFPGVVDPVDGSIRGTRLALRAWRGVPLAATLQQQLGLAVTVRNDAVGILVGESVAGAAAGEQDVVLAYSSAGVGGAIMLGGRLLLGRKGAAGHLGHVPSAAAAGLRCSCGGEGHLDSIASAAGMTRWYRDQRNLDPADAPYLRVVAQAAEGGDPVAGAALQLGGTALGMALGGVANLLEPDVVVLAGESPMHETYRAATAAALRSEVIPGNAVPEIRLSALGADAQVVGAALAARPDAKTG